VLYFDKFKTLLYSIDNILFSCNYYNFAIFLSNKYKIELLALILYNIALFYKTRLLQFIKKVAHSNL